jgi:hypothetical protein
VLALLSLLVQDFDGVAWADRAPELRGQVALVRWWTTGCSLCERSVPALSALSKKVPLVAVFHPKPPRDVDPAEAKKAAEALGLPGTVGVDRDWKVLRRWMGEKSYGFTSLTFLLDRKGAVRYVHPGGVIRPEDADELGRRIDALLAEKE